MIKFLDILSRYEAEFSQLEAAEPLGVCERTFRPEVFSRHGLPLSLHTDRGNHYFDTPEAGGKVDRANLTQVGRALDHLGVEHIAAYPPQARGRSERVFQTPQDRLTKELALAGIATVEAANGFLREVYVPSHKARFAVAAEQESSAFVAIAGVDLGEILCVREERQVGNDNCVSFNRPKLQIPASPPRAHFVKALVKVRHYYDGTHAIFHGPRCLGRYDRKGAPWTPKLPLKSARRRACGRPGQVSDLPTPPKGEQKQKKRTFDVLPKAANLIGYRQSVLCAD